MQEISIVKEFFSKLRCTQCCESFTSESVSVLRNEDNYTVVRVLCSHCGKNIGMAILGLDRKSMENAMEPDKLEASPINCADGENPISYDDVIDAHQFFDSLGDDWIKHVPQDNN